MDLSLKNLQQHFNKALLTGEYSKVAALIEGGGQLSSQQALDVYHKGLTARLTESLGETFEALWWVLGDEDFFKTCEKYIELHPSKFYNLGDYGKDFGQFAAKKYSDLPFLEDLARFEWTFKCVFHAPEIPRKLTGFQIHEDSKFQFCPSVKLFCSKYSVHSIWKHRADNPEEAPDVVWDWPEHLILHKKQADIYIHRVSPEGYEILSQLLAGYSVGEAIESSTKLYHDLTPEHVSEIFKLISNSNLLVEVQ